MGNPIVRPPTVGRAPLAWILASPLFHGTGIAGKLYLTLAAIGANRGKEVGSEVGTGRRPIRFEATYADLAGLILDKDQRGTEGARRAVARAARKLVAMELVREEGQPGRPTAWVIDQYRGRDGTVVPRTLWRNDWIRVLSGPGLAIYLKMLSEATEKQPRHQESPPNVRWMERSELLQASSPTTRRGLNELLRHGIIHRTDYGRTSYYLLLEPGLTAALRSDEAD